MKEKLQQIKEAALSELKAAECDTEALRVRYLGKKGELTAVLRGMGALTPEERPLVGQLANEVRAEIEAALTKRVAEEKERALEAQLTREKLDVTMPGTPARMGHQHPLTRAQREMEEIFIGMGFEIAEVYCDYEKSYECWRIEAILRGSQFETDSVLFRKSSLGQGGKSDEG